jgi:hypothetical protein
MINAQGISSNATAILSEGMEDGKGSDELKRKDSKCQDLGPGQGYFFAGFNRNVAICLSELVRSEMGNNPGS